MNRVVITGRGAVSPFGIGVPVLVDKLWAGETAIKVMTDWEEVQGLGSYLAAPVPSFDAKKFLPRSVRRTMGNMAIYAFLAAQEAIASAGVSPDRLKHTKTGMVIGSTTGSAAAYQDFYSRYLPHKQLDGIKSGEFFKMMGHSCVANVCLALGIQGEQWAPVSACTSSSQSVGLAYILIKAGRQDVVVCGGADEEHPSVTGVFDLLRAASCNNENPDLACRPFDRDRDGVVCGGGSGMLVLESYESAKSRGADILAEIVGFGNVTDSGHIANPNKLSLARSMSDALAEGDLASSDVDYVNAHATGTGLGDIAESQAIKDAVNSKVPVSSMKGHLGHTLGAAGSLELIAVLEMLVKQELLPTRGLHNIDPQCSCINVLQEKETTPLDVVLKNNFALGGVNTTLAIRRWKV